MLRDDKSALISELSEFTLDNQFFLIALFDTSYNLCIDVEAFADGNHFFRMLRRKIYFQTVSHIEYLVHFAPVRIALLLDGPEQRRNGEKVVFDNAAVISDKVQHFGLRTAGAVYHTVNFGTERIEQFLNHRRICTGGREHQLSGIQRTAFHAVCQFQLSAVYQFVGYGFVIAFRIFLRQIFGEYIVAGAGKSVAAHTAVILFS